MNTTSMARALVISAMTVCCGAEQVLAQSDTAPRQRSGVKKMGALPAVTPAEAKKLLDGDEGYIYLDVRTPEEFEAGRPKGAINIPVLFMDSETERRVRNEDFLAVVQAHLPKDAKIIVGCRSGSRSAMAQRLLYKAGYTNTTNMLGGFSGQTNPAGKVLQQGWSGLDYPVEQGAAGASGYEELKKKVKP